MKTMLEVCMYSGGCRWDPRCEMTPEQEATLMEKLSKLEKEAQPNRFGTGVLGADSFMVIWGVIEIKDDGFEMPINADYDPSQFKYSMIRALPGRITVYHSFNKERGIVVTMYEDTENIHSFLADLAAPSIKAHYDLANKQIQDYWDNLGTPETKK